MLLRELFERRKKSKSKRHPFLNKLVGSVEREGNQLDEGARIQHAEDVIFWEGSKGAARALESLKSLEKGGHKNLSIKFDGSPAIIFGRDEVTGEFILTDKSGFSAKGYDGKSRSGKDLQKMILNRKTSRGLEIPDSYKAFSKNMRMIFDLYEKAVPKDHTGFFKGDLLYFNTPDKAGKDWVFTPNMVTYKVAVDSEIGQKIGRSISGVVIHNEVSMDGNDSPLSIDANSYFQSDKVLVFPPVLVQKPPTVNNEQIKHLQASISKNANFIDDILNKDNLVNLKLSDLPNVFYTYTNSKVDTGMDNLGKDFLQWLGTSKVSEPKKRKIKDYIREHRQGFAALWTIVKEIQEVKDDIIDQLDNQDAEVRASIGDMPGGEGYVLKHPDGPMKLVNRAGFTAANRAVAR